MVSPLILNILMRSKSSKSLGITALSAAIFVYICMYVLAFANVIKVIAHLFIRIMEFL